MYKISEVKLRISPAISSYLFFKVIGYQGKATLIASLVSVPESSDENPKPHPHRLEGQNAENGVVVKKDLEITSENNIIP